MKVDSETHFEMMRWCILHIPRVNSYRIWRFEYPQNQKHGEPYEFTAHFERKEDEKAFNLRWLK